VNDDPYQPEDNDDTANHPEGQHGDPHHVADLSSIQEESLREVVGL
jgi:hypothetical protein